MSAIGILGGMGPQASARLYELLIEGTASFTPAAIDSDFPEIVLLNVPVPNFVSNKNNLPKAKAILVERTKLLEAANCSVIGIACNTAHILLHDLQAATNVPFVSLPQLVAQRVKLANFKRVGLLATPTTLNSTLYDDAFVGIAELIRPTRAFGRQIERVIYRKLGGRLTAQEQRTFRRDIAKFKQANTLDAVILGCTELPLVFGGSNDPSVLDTLQILSEALLEAYFKN